ncbi:MAG: family 16 glycosylhydrolase [Bacteroidales bacterium]|nr:family 16 glycosylhydrolase [Bacteroidales bacterium]MCF8455285.1 family 16 glycosylhydrolase [Bacteroidales bacterium]
MKKWIFYLWIFWLWPLCVNAQFFSDNCSGGTNILPVQDINLCNDSEWVLVFEDNFDGDSLDRGKWKGSNYPGSIQGGAHQNVVTLRNVVVENGILNLIAKPEQVQELVILWLDSNEILSDGLPNYRWFNYTAGLTKSLRTYSYGYFEASCKIPSGKGIWPAMWMYGDYKDQYNNTIEQEIDVFEFWEDKPNVLNMNVHHDGVMCPSKNRGSDYSKNYHTYGLLWEPYKIEWYVDGELIRRYSRYYQYGSDVGCRLNAWQPYQETPFPKDSMTLIFNIAVDNRDGNKPDGSTPFPAKFQIDWIRYYMREDIISASKGDALFSQVFPNPNVGYIRVEVENNNSGPVKMKVVDMQFTTLFQKELNEPSTEIDIRFLGDGMYFIIIENPANHQINRHKVLLSK